MVTDDKEHLNGNAGKKGIEKNIKNVGETSSVEGTAGGESDPPDAGETPSAPEQEPTVAQGMDDPKPGQDKQPDPVADQSESVAEGEPLKIPEGVEEKPGSESLTGKADEKVEQDPPPSAVSGAETLSADPKGQVAGEQENEDEKPASGGAGEKEPAVEDAAMTTGEVGVSTESEAAHVGPEEAEKNKDIVHEKAVAHKVPEEAGEKSKKEEALEDHEVKEEKDHDEEEHDQEHDEDHHEEHHLDYSNYSKKQLVQVLESLIGEDDFIQIGKILKEIRPAFDELYQSEKDEAYKKYLEDGGEKDGFEYKDDELDLRFEKAFNNLRDRKNEHFSSVVKQKDENLARKQALLETLRELVDSEETTASISELKKIQQQWRTIGPVSHQHMKSLWANYNALIDRYYDQRSIYFELKELDRKKNLKLKIELCERAEKLNEVEQINEAIKELNELHEEFKLIGPVPLEDQEPLWQRFKTASDLVYSKRKDYFDGLKAQLNVNLAAKEALIEKVDTLSAFDSDRISEWNAKTREILDLQKEWESIGGLPRDKAKKINKTFWAAFKTFFNKKGAFFKKLEESRKENLAKKEALVEQAEALKDNEDFDKTAESLKSLQRQWKDIGPVPQRQKDEIFKRFKAACDHFFERRRAQYEKTDEDYKDNLEKKAALCKELEDMATAKADAKRIESIIDEYSDIGYVPKNALRSIQQRFNNAVAAAIDKTGLSDREVQKLKFSAQFKKMNHGPGADRFLQKKENDLRRQIAKLENDISLWRNNLDFFADSKQADKVREEFNLKIDKATRLLEDLKGQLSVISNI